MRLIIPIHTSNWTATIKEITPNDFVLALHLALIKFGDVRVNEVNQDFWQDFFLENKLIELNGQFTKDEYLSIYNQFFELNEVLFQKADNTSSEIKPAKKLKRLIKEIQTECSTFITLFNHQNVFNYGFSYIYHLQQLHAKK